MIIMVMDLIGCWMRKVLLPGTVEFSRHAYWYASSKLVTAKPVRRFFVSADFSLHFVNGLEA